MDNNPAVTVPATSTLSSSRAGGVASTTTSDSKPGSAPPSSPQYNSKNDHGWRRVVRNFSPSWFSVTMGTGIVAVLFANIPWRADWLYYLSIIFFILNTVLFFSAFAISILRYTIWPEIWTVMVQDSTNSLFLGTIPMGFATLVSMWISVCVPAWGGWAVYVAFGMWVLDSIVAVAVTVTLGILLYAVRPTLK
jgi:tellurite resistance protein TehA-like permease